jgi:hypothetical protein
MTTPLAQFPQMGNGTKGEPDRDEASNDNELQKQLLRVLEDVRNDQKEYLSMRRERWGLVDYSQMARSLVTRPAKSWSGIYPGSDILRSDDPVEGRDFLFSLLRPKPNMALAKQALQVWMSKSPQHSTVLADLITQLEGNDDIRFEWPEGIVEHSDSDVGPDWIPVSTCSGIEVTYAIPSPGPPDRALWIRHPPQASANLFNDKVLLALLCLRYESAKRSNRIDPLEG